MPYSFIRARILFLLLSVSLLIACSAATTETAVTHAPSATATTEVNPTKPEPTATEVAETETAVPPPTLDPERETPEAALTYLPAENVFTLVSTTPIIDHGPEGAWDSTNISAGPIVFHDGKYHMLQNALTGWPPRDGGTAYSISEDGYSWSRVGDESVFSAADIDDKQVPFASAAYVQPDGTWVMYFNTWPLNAVSHKPSIYRATAPDPSGPWTVDTDPVLEPGSNGSWDGGGVEAPSVLQIDDGFVMYFAGNDFGRKMIGLATSPDGITWEKYNDPATNAAKFAESDPILIPNEDNTAWDSGPIMNVDVIQTSDGWVMVYNSRRGTAQATGYALSEDGFNWQRSEAPIINPQDVSGGRGSYGPSIRFIDGTYHLFVEIVVDGTSSVYLATHEGSLLP